MTIGEIIYNRRKELGLTLEEIGNATGVSKDIRYPPSGTPKNFLHEYKLNIFPRIIGLL